MVIAEFQEEIRTANSSLMECLMDLELGVRQAALNGTRTPGFVVHCMCYIVGSFDVLNHDYSCIS